MNARRALVRGTRFGLLSLLGAHAACRARAGAKPDASADAGSAVSSVGAAKAVAQAPSVTEGATTSAPSASAGAVTPHERAMPASSGDPCRLLKGPIQLPFTGAATVWIDDGAGPDQDPRIVFNRDGAPRPVRLPELPPRTAPSSKPDPRRPAGKDAAPKAADRPERLALTEPAERATVPGCVMAGPFVYCMAASGAIHRTTLAGDGDVVIASGRPGSSLAAEAFPGGEPVLAFLADQKSTEGIVTMAFAALGDSPPLRISEDGSGATFVALAGQGTEIMAMYIDARRALTPLHARTLALASGRLHLGADAVLFVGEGSDRRPAGAIVAGATGPMFGLLPTFKDASTFGMAAVLIDAKPRDDAPVTWADYPGGLERSPVAATRGVTPPSIALVRPASSEPKAKRVIELGEMLPSGAFKALCVAAESATFADVTLTADRFGALWLTYTNADGTWIERRGKGP